MFNCQNLLHPFQNDPGTSQRQRVIDQLVSASVKIDGRSLAELLNYFSDLSTGINYYDTNLSISDWQPFFGKSLPFLLASISRFDYKAQQGKFELYKLLFGRAVSSSGLQLIIHFIYYNTIYKIDNWYEEVQQEDLPIKATLEELIRNKLSKQLRAFILLANASAKWFGTKRIDFSPLLHTGENNVWELSLKDIHSIDEGFMGEVTGRCEQMKLLFEKLTVYFSYFIEAIKLLAGVAENDIPASLVPAGNELKKNHPPHLALVFAFIQLFQKMQEELNKKTKEHLKYFYTEVLQIKPREAQPDRANIVFEIQKILQDQYQKHLLQKGTELTGGRDSRNADILFDSDDEIVVNETQIAEVRTLFLNNQLAVDKTYVEGVYIAPAADKADGIDKDFKDDDPKNWYTLGRNISKYTEPGKKSTRPYPFARMGFVLASPVLYLKEGKRTVEITIDCTYEDSICNAEEALCKSNNGDDCPEYPEFYTAGYLFPFVRDFLADGLGNPLAYIVISSPVLEDAAAAGMSNPSVSAIRDRFLRSVFSNPCTNEPRYQNFLVVDYPDWETYINTPANASILQEVNKLPDLFKKRYPFKISFSGEKEWIEPSTIIKLQLVAGLGSQFNFVISVQLDADKPSVSFYNRENLGEDLGTEMPAVKIELDDLLKLQFSLDLQPDCCLEKKINNEDQFVSLYHFFRNTVVRSNTKIDVTVCGLKNFIVQNDENIMDVNSIVFPFGTRPKIGSNFYISANEVFCKNWKEFDVKFNWKDLPSPDLKTYYHGYEDKLTNIKSGDLDNNRFVFQYGFLENGTWYPDPTPVFPAPPAAPADATNNAAPFHLLFKPDPLPLCIGTAADCLYNFTRVNLNPPAYKRKGKDCFLSLPFRNDSRSGFLRLVLRNQDFQHSRYSFILTRQMLALGKFPDVYVGPVYDGIDPIGNVTLPVMSFDDLFKAIEDSYTLTESTKGRLHTVIDAIRTEYINQGGVTPFPIQILAGIADAALGAGFFKDLAIPPGTVIPDGAVPPLFTGSALDTIINFLDDPILKKVYDKIKTIQQVRVVIPNEPYTPQMQAMTIDYKATANLPTNDIDLIHLYPFTGTYKTRQIDLNPSLFPSFCDEGTLFIGLKDLQPANNLHILFQLAEATADSETPSEKLFWHYLDRNVWKPLRNGFEVLMDETLNLTSTGIIKFSLPENMTNDNTVMPAGIHWIKASMPKNSTSASETLNIYTQAISATFTIKEGNDTGRLINPLAGGSIAKLLVADPAIKKVDQPYESFDGRLPELEGSYYTRVSELLRHKGRAIQKWDYERLVLEEFPQIYKAKCINHSFHTNAHLYENDIPYAPGYVMLALIPDLTKLKAGNSYEPKVPVSLLEKAELYLKKITSPFVRLKAANPRYEKVNFCLTVRLVLGKDKTYFTEQLKTDLREFLAPWAIGKYDKLSFGQCVYRSDVLRFLEQSSYVDFVSGFRMTHETDPLGLADQPSVCPLSPRSILVAGDIDVLIDDPACDQWCSRSEGVNQCDETELVHNYCK